MIKQILLYTIFLLISIFTFCTEVLASEPYNNIYGFYGERAAGLSGAYTALSDDPSGAFYNPAGLAFSYHDGFSISASNFKNTSKSYKGVDTPGQVYSQRSEGFEPNFIGVLKRYNNIKFGFSVINTYNYSYDRTDQVNLPLVSPTINQTKNFTKEKYSQLLAGPSFAFLITNKLSFGISLYYIRDTKNFAKTQFQRYTDNTSVMRSFIDNRMTGGVMPIIGIQYQPFTKLALGASLRRIFVGGGNRLYNEVYIDTARTNSINSVDFVEGTDNGYSSIESGRIYKRPNLNSSIPQTTEVRLGLAFFPTSRFLTSFDTIYTSGYKTFRNQDTFSSLGNSISYSTNNGEVRELTRRSTVNFAAGMEYYIAETFAILGGVFTNEPNSKPISWAESAVDLALQNSISNQFSTTSGNNTIIYQLPRSGTNPRNEYSRNRGFSLGMSWVTSKSSFSLTYIHEQGRGMSRIDPNSLAQSFEYKSDGLYIMVSSRN